MPGTLTLLVGVGLSVGLFATVLHLERQKARRKFEGHSQDMSLALEQWLQVSLNEVEALAGFYDASNEVTRAEFRTFVGPYLSRQSGILSIEWVARVPGKGVTQDAHAADCFPVTLAEPQQASETALGFDLASDAACMSALRDACLTGTTRMTGPVRLAREMGDGTSFLLLCPVYKRGTPTRTAVEREQGLEGFAAGVFRAGDALQAAIGHMRHHNIDVLLRDDAVAGRGGMLGFYSSEAGRALALGPTTDGTAPAMKYEVGLGVAGRRWDLTFTPTPSFMAASRRWYPWGLLGISLVLSGVLALIAQHGAQEAERVERLVGERTAALSTANRMLTAEMARRQETQAALREARDGLEQKVVERTAELVEANRSLTLAVSERQEAQEDLERTNEQLEVALEEVKRAQGAIVDQERMHALAQMASGIAHDFNNSLSQILGFTELLLARPEDLADRDKAARFLEFIQAAASHAADVVRRMRGFYRPAEKDDTELPVPVEQMVDQAVEMAEPRWKDLARKGGLDVEIRKDLEESLTAVGSPRELSEMLANLLLNAVEAMDESGTITVSARRHGAMVRLSVADTGCGMDEEVVRRCTEPFYSSRGTEGSGLGLSMVRGVVKRHGGALTIESTPGEGTTLTVDLPAWPRARKETAATAAEDGGPGLRVLLVDDDAMVGEVLQGFLQAAGHVVLTVRSGEEALRSLEDDRFDVVITDRSMPDMSGDKLAQAVKERSPGRPVIMVTGFGDLMADAGELPTAVDLVVPKPVSMDGLRQAVAKVTAGA